MYTVILAPAYTQCSRQFSDSDTLNITINIRAANESAIEILYIIIIIIIINYYCYIIIIIIKTRFLNIIIIYYYIQWDVQTLEHLPAMKV